MNAIQDWILTVSDAWWVHLVVFAFCGIDAFFPTVPSESIIVALSSLWSSSGNPPIVLVALSAWAGAFGGDNLAYAIGRKLGWERFRFLREGRGRAAVVAAEAGLERRALLLLMTARYIPFGRTAVNLTAGAVEYPWQKFWKRSLAATFVWAVYSCAIGAVAGAWFENNHLLAITVAVVLAVIIALIVERLVTWLNDVLDRRHARRSGEEIVEREAELARIRAELAEALAAGDEPRAAELADLARRREIVARAAPRAGGIATGSDPHPGADPDAPTGPGTAGPGPASSRTASRA